MLFTLKDITGWTKGTERINSLELFFKDSDHLIEKWETLKPDGTKTHFEFELTIKPLTANSLTTDYTDITDDKYSEDWRSYTAATAQFSGSWENEKTVFQLALTGSRC